MWEAAGRLVEGREAKKEEGDPKEDGSIISRHAQHTRRPTAVPSPSLAMQAREQ